MYSLDFPFAYGQPRFSADFRTEPEDFQVDEFLGFEPSGEGEHVYLQVWKRGENTAWVAEKIAELAHVAVMDIGYCGRKDRHAVTTQWFSVYLPKLENEPNWTLLNSSSIQILVAKRHQQKLRRGDHEKNYFVIRLRNLQSENYHALDEKIIRVLTEGVPNYFGEQRFGHGGNNLNEAQAILVDGKKIRDKQKRGLFLSAARSYLFNRVLAARVNAGSWKTIINGEPEIFPSAPLWGRGRSLASGDLEELERNILLNWNGWCDGLEHAGLMQERRALMLIPADIAWQRNAADLVLSFSLSAGEFATTVLRELAILNAMVKTESIAV